MVVNSAESVSVYSLYRRLCDAESTQNDQITVEVSISGDKRKHSLNRVGKAIDKFLAPRPWWNIIDEPYHWKASRSTTRFVIKFRRIRSKWDSILQQIASVQYPSACQNSLLTVHYRGGFDSFGNIFYDYETTARDNIWGIFNPYLTGPDINFLDDHSCKKLANKFECAFLPATNCSMPINLHKYKDNAPFLYFTNATITAKHLTLDEFYTAVKKQSADHPEYYSYSSESIPKITRYTYSGLFKPDESSTLKTLKKAKNTYESWQLLFCYLFLFRPNYDFRMRIARHINEWNNSLPIPFPMNELGVVGAGVGAQGDRIEGTVQEEGGGDCVAVRIRRDDRVVEGVDIYDWCKWNNPNVTTCFLADESWDTHYKCIAYHDMGCNMTMPYGAATLTHFLKAAKSISTSKNILIGTDDEKWLKNELKTVNREGLNIYTFFAPPGHRKNSIKNGVNYFAAITLARKCKSLVGQTGSAVTMLFLKIMCAQSANRIGECPPVYDLNNG
eukprot:gene6148-12455_t